MPKICKSCSYYIMNLIWTGFTLNLIPFISLFIVKCIYPFAYKPKNYAIFFLYYFVNVNAIYYLYSSHRISYTDDTYSIVPLISYTICFEGVFYIWHRISHIPGLYKILHAHHHVNYHISPMDFIDVDYTDSLGFHVCMHLPLTIIPLDSLEYLSWYFVIMTSGFLLHSDLLGNHHILHHKYFHCNYCFLFPICDVLMGTHRIN